MKNTTTKILYKNKVIQKLDFYPINALPLHEYKIKEKTYIIVSTGCELNNIGEVVEKTIIVEPIETFKKRKKLNPIINKTIPPPRPKEDNVRYVIQKREKIKGSWGNWLNYKDFGGNEEERDMFLKSVKKDSGLLLEYRGVKKYKKGVNLSQEQKKENQKEQEKKGTGSYLILVKRKDPQTKRTTNWKLYKRFSEEKDRSNFYNQLVKEKDEYIFFKFKNEKPRHIKSNKK